MALADGSLELNIAERDFSMNGEPFDMWGVRVASAATSDEGCAGLLASLDDYVAHGINSVTVFLQGSSGGFMPAFSEDGARLDPGVQRRVLAILDATRQRRMAVILGLFYQRQGAWLRTGPSFEAAARTAARLVRPWRHVILNVANEQNSHHWRGCPYPMNDPTATVRLCEIVAEEDAERLVGGGGYDPDHNVTIARSPEVSLLLFDGADYEEGNTKLAEAGVATKPLVNVELFGARAGGLMLNEEGRMVQGAWPEVSTPRERGRRDFLRAIDFHARTPGLYLFGHFQGWCQGLGHGLQNRYDLGGQGTLADPGIRWYFETVRAVRESALR